MWIREGHGSTRNLSQSGSDEQGEEQRFKGIFRPKSEIQAVFTGDLQKQNKLRSSPNLQRIFRPKTGDLQKKKRFSTNLQEIFRPKSEIQAVFPAENGWSLKKKKKRSSSQKCHDIRCQSTKNTNLGLDLHSSSPEPVNFFGAQSSLGGAQFSFGGSTARYAPRGAGSATLYHRHQMMYYSCSSYIGCIIHIIINHSAHHNEVYYEARL